MATELINKLSTFNGPTIKEEIAALTLPAVTVKFSGFENTDIGRLQPFPEATRVIARRRVAGVVEEDTAAKGDIRFETRNALTAPQVTAITAVLDAHDDAVDHSSQIKKRQHIADVAALRALFDAGIAEPTLNLAAKLALVQEGEDV